MIRLPTLLFLAAISIVFSLDHLALMPLGSIAYADHDYESLKLGSGPVSVRVSFTAPGETWTGTLLSRRAPPGEPSLTVTAFMQQPFGKRFIGVAMDGIADRPNQAAARTVRDDIVGGHLICAFTEMDASLDGGTQELVFRTDGKTSELFIDGIQRESRSAEKFTARTYLKLYPHSKLGWKTGSDLSGGDPFSGTIEKIEVQPKWLEDTESRSETRQEFRNSNAGAESLGDFRYGDASESSQISAISGAPRERLPSGLYFVAVWIRVALSSFA